MAPMPSPMPIPIMGFIIMGFMPPIPIAPIPMLLLGFMLFILQADHGRTPAACWIDPLYLENYIRN